MAADEKYSTWKDFSWIWWSSRIVAAGRLKYSVFILEAKQEASVCSFIFQQIADTLRRWSGYTNKLINGSAVWSNFTSLAFSSILHLPATIGSLRGNVN